LGKFADANTSVAFWPFALEPEAPICAGSGFAGSIAAESG
jgi:hypothetical protein